MEAPAGWYEVIRGPRPPSVQWPRVKGVQQQNQRPFVNPVRDPRRRVPVVAPQKPISTQGPRKSREEIQASAQASIIRLEKALAFLDESDVIAREALEGSLKRARSQAATVPVLERIKSCEEFVRRAQKRLSQAEVAVTEAVERRERMKVEFEVRYTFIQIAKKKKTHPKTLSSKNIFIPKTLSSKTISSKTEDNFIHDTFIPKRVHPMTLSSKNGFVQ